MCRQLRSGNLRDHHAAVICGPVGDFILRGNVPVYAVRAFCPVSGAADFHQEDIVYDGVLFIGEKTLGDFQLVTVEEFRPVALLAGVSRRAEAMYRSLNGVG